MKVLDLRCAQAHAFEGWFAGEDEFVAQNSQSLIECPLCGDRAILRLPSAPRLNLSHARPPKSESDRAAGAGAGNGAGAASSAAAASTTSRSATSGTSAMPMPSEPKTSDVASLPDLQAAWFEGVRRLMASTEDVGGRFAEEARRIHYGETAARGIRGQATADEREALRDEGIETVSVPIPRALQGPLQ